MVDQEIELESFDDDAWLTNEASIGSGKIDFEFEQFHERLGLRRKLTIFNQHRCYHTLKQKGKKKQEHKIDLLYLDPHPLRETKVAWVWFFACMSLMLVDTAMIYLAWFSDLVVPPVWFYVSLAVAILATLISLRQLIHNSRDQIVFVSRYGRVKSIEMTNKYPDKASFRHFISWFIVQVKQQAKEKNYSEAKLLTRELQEIRRLKDEGMISEKEYESGKTKILGHDSHQVS